MTVGALVAGLGAAAVVLVVPVDAAVVLVVPVDAAAVGLFVRVAVGWGATPGLLPHASRIMIATAPPSMDAR